MRPVLERLLGKVSVPESGGCWLWEGYVNNKGYGRIGVGLDVKYVHRVAYEISNGPIPDGLQIDHLCKVRRCVNPKHLEPVTNRENNFRGESICYKNKRKTHCPKGHCYNTTNTYVKPSGYRECRSCCRERCRIYYHKKKGVSVGTSVRT